MKTDPSTHRHLIDLSSAPAVDAHCHGFTRQGLAKGSPDGFFTRLTLMGMCLASSNTADSSLAGAAGQMARDSLFYIWAKRRLARFLGCSENDAAHVRKQALDKDPAAYTASLMKDANMAGLLVDDGYPLPKVDRADMEKLTGTTVHRVARIEPMIEEAKKATNRADDFMACFQEKLEDAAADPHCVAFKSIIAYRTGLDITHPDIDQAAAAYNTWKSEGFREDRRFSKPVRDHLMHVTMGVATRFGLPMHLHTGGGDPDVVLTHARPSLLAPFINQYFGHSVVLIHGGHPWSSESAYLASVFPMVYIDLSVMMPWTTLAADGILAEILGQVPACKVFHGSDEASEPEIIWLAARLCRQTLERVLGRAVKRGFCDTEEALRLGRGILCDNVLSLHRRG